MRATVFALLLAAAPVVAAAQDRNANVYNGTAHEPAAGDVHAREGQAGVAQPPQARERENDEVEQLDRQVLRQSEQTMPKNPPKPVDETGR